MTILQALNLATSLLKKAPNNQSPRLDAQVILAFVLKKNRTFLFAHDKDTLEKQKEKLFFNLIKKRLTGLAVCYITGQKEFYGLDFFVTKDVLPPKPDTETLVELCLQYIKSLPPQAPPLELLDVCTGSACIAISLCSEVKKIAPNIKITATDISKKALKIAKINVKNHKMQDCITLLQMDLLEGLVKKNKKFDIIVSNPPYVPYTLAKKLLQDGRGEPLLALNGDDIKAKTKTTDGTALIARLLPQMHFCLKKGGSVFIEAGEYNIQKCAFLMQQAFFCDIAIYKDMTQKQRVIKGCIK